jgi:hypothetical protein
MAIDIAVRIFRLCPFHEKSGGRFPHPGSTDRPPERCPFGTDPGGRFKRTTRNGLDMV